MIQRLCIQNYALIDNLDLVLEDELNILTGETGAGKSIIMGALNLILGQRAESKYFFNQQKKCIIEGHFIIGNYHLQDFFLQNDLDYEQHTCIRREITIDGKSRAFINDTPVTLAVLKELGEQLIDIHSQHATQQINNRNFQLSILDIIAEQQPLVNTYQQTYQHFKDLCQQRQEAQEELSKATTEQDFIQFQLTELQEAQLTPDEQTTLEEEQKRLSHAEQIKVNLLNIENLFSETENSILSQLKTALSLLHHTSRYSTASTPIATRLESCLIELKDIQTEVESLQNNTHINEERLAHINDRLSLIYQLQQKHRLQSIEELLALQQQLSNQQNQHEHLAAKIRQLDISIEKTTQQLYELATTISKNRERAIPIIESDLRNLFVAVNMPDAVLKIENNTAALTKETLNINGIDHINFLFSANKGQQALPIHKVASGGELSRLMLAIKYIIAKQTALPTIIFDEIDTGISGEAAVKVGNVIAEMSHFMQVIAITHLPQIASKGHAHYYVYKETANEQTISNIAKLNPQQRITEIATMLSGHNPNEYALQHATELLNKA